MLNFRDKFFFFFFFNVKGKKILNFRSSLFELKMKFVIYLFIYLFLESNKKILLFDIYDSISK